MLEDILFFGSSPKRSSDRRKYSNLDLLQGLLDLQVKPSSFLLVIRQISIILSLTAKSLINFLHLGFLGDVIVISIIF